MHLVIHDSGAAMHVKQSHRQETCVKKVPIGNTCEVNDNRDVLIKDELGTLIVLKDAHFVQDIDKHQ